MATNPKIVSNRANHEALFVNAFVIPERRQRWLESLASTRKRERFLFRLADGRDFNHDLMRRLEVKSKEPSFIASALQRDGAQEDCYIISCVRELDGRYLDLFQALQNVVGLGLGSVISCLPGKLAFYESETAGERWILKSSKP
jgi:hypothetical protein